jgi:hypothetical protein
LRYFGIFGNRSAKRRLDAVNAFFRPWREKIEDWVEVSLLSLRYI